MFELLLGSIWRCTSLKVRDMIPFSFVGRKISNSVRVASIYKIVLAYKIESWPEVAGSPDELAGGGGMASSVAGG